jgi:cardiolipin synthase A/B
MVRLRSRWFSVLFGTLAVMFGCSSAELKGPQATPTGSSGEVPSVEDDSGVPQPPDGGKRDPTVDGGTIPTSAAVTIQVQPSDSGTALINAIRGAKKSVHMTMYLLTNDDAIDALGDQKQAGKDVKVVLNQKFPTTTNDNQIAYDKLKARGVPVVWAPANYTFTHAKTIILDAEKVIIMTMNLTETSAATNREYIATDSDPGDVKDAETLFAADYSNTNAYVTGKLVVSPSAATPVDPRTRLKALIDSAKTSLDVESQSLSDDKIADAIILAHKAGVAVRVVIDADTSVGSPAQNDVIAKFKGAGVPIKKVGSPDIHAKAIVVDESLTFVGSQNLTPTALSNNREIGLITDAKAEATKVRAAIAADFQKGFTP